MWASESTNNLDRERAKRGSNACAEKRKGMPHLGEK